MIYQFKVELKDVGIPVWRRLQVDSEMTFKELHQVLLIAFDCFGTHFHDFEIRKSNGESVKNIRIGREEDAEESAFKRDELIESLKDGYEKELFFIDFIEEDYREIARDNLKIAIEEKIEGLSDIHGRILNEEKVKLSDWFKQEKDRPFYTYDFGDDWKHVIVLEKNWIPILR